MILRQFFTEDGTYGDAREGFAVINTSKFTADEREAIINCADSDRLDVALSIKELHENQAGLDPVYDCDWEDLPDTINDLKTLLESQWQDQEMQNAVVLIKRIANALGV